ncbi:hypothetical protein [Clostridium butyricum]|uniref:hypothetical protein n=1 Tax=Clostridium butyricum TaxID=1492 RepID=UPI00071E536C
MNSKSFWLDRWCHVIPKKECDNKGRREIICRLCIGPLETDIYGIENDKFYHEYNYIEGLLEGEVDFYYISKEEFIKELEFEIKLSIEHQSYELTHFLLETKDVLVNN